MASHSAAMQPFTHMRRFVTLLAAILLGVSSSFSQQTTATFAGIVTDSSAAVLPGATIQIVNEGTSAVRQQVSGDTGEFLFNFVPVGKYTLKISRDGFKTLENRGIELGAAQNVRRTFSLEVGSITDSVNVNTDAPLVNALTSEQRVSIETLEVKNLPMYNRNMTNILDIGTGLNRDETGQQGGRGAQRLRLNGLGGSAMTITADGTNGSMNGGSAASISGYGGYNKIDVMSAEAIAEIQVVKGAFPAEYGFTMGGNLSLISKSGTNAWHGSLFHRYEGASLSARNAFLTARPKDVWNQFGGSIGGPILRDRLFFFLAYEGYRQRSADPLSAVVPTPYFRDLILKGLKVPEAQLMLNYYPLPNGTYGQPIFWGSGTVPRRKNTTTIISISRSTTRSLPARCRCPVLSGTRLLRALLRCRRTPTFFTRRASAAASIMFWEGAAGRRPRGSDTTAPSSPETRPGIPRRWFPATERNRLPADCEWVLSPFQE